MLKLDYPRGEIISSKYEIVDRLGDSPLGITYRVKHLKNGKYVRLLLLNPEYAGRDNKEELIAAYKTGKRLQHPHLLKLGELSEHNGVAYITSQDFEGVPLRELLSEHKANGKPFALREAAQITTQILDAVSALHQHGMVFRALRPDNILVNVKRTGPRGMNVIAQVRLTGTAFWDLIPPGVLAEWEFTRGEAQYLAPELKGFDPQPEARSDIYSAGVVFYEMLVGTAPLGTFQLPRTRRPDLPKHIDSVVELALANAPEDRYPSAQDFVTDIQRTFQMAPEVTDEAKKGGINPMFLVLAGGVIAAVAGLFLMPKSDPEQELQNLDSLARNEIIEAYNMQAAQAYDDERRSLQKTWSNMVYIPAGPYLEGRLHTEKLQNAEPLAQKTELDAFLIDAFEFPNLQGAPPKTDVTYKEAEAMCAEQGKRLCSASEFEKACKGTRSNIYGYGDYYDPAFCVDKTSADGTHASGALGECKSSWGVYDIAGNYAEWTSTAPDAGRRIVKGGGRGEAERTNRCAYNTETSEAMGDAGRSFRCCVSVSDAMAKLNAPPEEPHQPGGDAEVEQAAN